MRDPSNHAVRRAVSDAEARGRSVNSSADPRRRDRIAYSLLRNYAGAEDAAQAAFLSAWLHRHDLREPQASGVAENNRAYGMLADRAANTPGDRSD